VTGVFYFKNYVAKHKEIVNMPQYCDSKVLERNWFLWLISTSVPELEDFRERGLLWTKIIGRVDGNPKYLDPLYQVRAHCIALPNPFYFNSYDGKVAATLNATIGGKKVKWPLSKVRKALDLKSNAKVHGLGDPFVQQDKIIPDLESNGYMKESPSESTWHFMLEDVSKICRGISTKFNLPSEEEQVDLSEDALLQVVNKLIARKLVYTPGRAPVFNLLTTTIHRCMYSIMNKRNKQKQNMFKLASDLQSGVLPESMRSLRVPGGGKTIRT
jgi:hypothetical protein